MRATVAICTNGVNLTHYRTAVSSALRQEFDDFEVLVISDGAALHQVPQVRLDSSVAYVHPQPSLGLNAARNHAMRVARGELVAFLDDDEMAEPTWLAALVAGLERHPEASCVGGPMRVVLAGGRRRRLPHTCGDHTLREGEHLFPAEEEVPNLIGGNLLVPKRVWEQVGDFNEQLSGWGDEQEWIERARAVGPAFAIPDARVAHLRHRWRLSVPSLMVTAWSHGEQIARFNEVTDRAPKRQVVARSLAHALKRRCWAGVTHAIANASVAVHSPS